MWFSNLLKVILELKFQKCGLEIRELKISFQDWGFTQHIHCSYIVEGNIAISLKNDLPKNGPTLPYTIKIGKLFPVEKMGNFEKYSPLLFGSRHWPTIWTSGAKDLLAQKLINFVSLWAQKPNHYMRVWPNNPFRFLDHKTRKINYTWNLIFYKFSGPIS